MYVLSNISISVTDMRILTSNELEVSDGVWTFQALNLFSWFNILFPSINNATIFITISL